jgi:hypothetical protein
MCMCVGVGVGVGVRGWVGGGCWRVEALLHGCFLFFVPKKIQGCKNPPSCHFSSDLPYLQAQHFFPALHTLPSPPANTYTPIQRPPPAPLPDRAPCKECAPAPSIDVGLRDSGNRSAAPLECAAQQRAEMLEIPALQDDACACALRRQLGLPALLLLHAK